MSNHSPQELYDKAFHYWQQENHEKALEYIEQALEYAPQDLAVHALAMHIKKKDRRNYSYLPHAEFIMDHDIHFRDKLDKDCDTPDFIIWALFAYSCMDLHKEKKFIESGKVTDADKKLYKYYTMALQAGYRPGFIHYYSRVLVKMERIEELLTLGGILYGFKKGSEAGLPGLDSEENSEDERGEILSDIRRALFTANRFEEARDFFQSVLQKDPGEWQANDFLGEVYSWLDQPAETARQWILALQKCMFNDWGAFDFKKICDLVADPRAGKKAALYQRICEVEKTVPVEKKGAARNLRNTAYTAIGNPEKSIMDVAYVEGKLGVTLPPLEEKHYSYFYNLWLPGVQGKHPFKPTETRPAQSSEQSPVQAVTAGTAKAKLDAITNYGVDITALARAGKLPPIVGRDREIDSLVRILLRMEKNNPVLLGPAGVGKTAIIHGLAQRIVSETVPDFLKNRRIFELTMSVLVAGTTFRGDFEQRITRIINEARDNPDIILFVDELHTIMGAGSAGRGDLDAANIVKPALAKGNLRLSGATTSREYGARIERDAAMARRFTPVRIREMGRLATLNVLEKRRDVWQEYHKVSIPDEILILAVDLTDIQVKNRTFPDKAIDLLDESCAGVRMRRQPGKNGIWTLRPDDVKQVMMEWKGAADTSTLSTDEADTQNIRVPSRQEVYGQFKRKVIGQDKAVNFLTELVIRLRLSLKDPRMPLSLLFYGPAGCGKTTCTESLASIIWPLDTDKIMHLNFSEYDDNSGLYRLIGFPPGYGGADDDGLLSARLKRHPYSIVTISNLSEAHPRVLAFFEQLLRHGTYFDGSGLEITAADTLFIIHENTTSRPKSMGFVAAKQKHNSRVLVMADLKHKGVPEQLCSLITHTVEFEELKAETVKSIIAMRLDTVREEYSAKGLKVTFNSSLVERLGDLFLTLPPEQRDVATLIDKEIGPKIRTALLEGKKPADSEIALE